MAEFKRTVKCSNCGHEANIYLTTDMAMSELLLHGKCPSCSNSLQLNFNVVGESDKPEEKPPETGGETPTVNLDETLFEPELPSSEIKDLIED